MLLLVDLASCHTAHVLLNGNGLRSILCWVNMELFHTVHFVLGSNICRVPRVWEPINWDKTISYANCHTWASSLCCCLSLPSALTGSFHLHTIVTCSVFSWEVFAKRRSPFPPPWSSQQRRQTPCSGHISLNPQTSGQTWMGWGWWWVCGSVACRSRD